MGSVNTVTQDKIAFARLVDILKQIVRGTHDSCPTRRLPQTPEASKIDSWWLEYFMSQQKAHRDLAKEAITLLEHAHAGTPPPPPPPQPSPPVAEEIVRVLRVVEYVGPRVWVESTVARSVQGTRVIDGNKEIRAASIGTYPDVLYTDKKED